MRYLVSAAVLCAGLSCLSLVAAAATPETVETKAKVAGKAQTKPAKAPSNAAHHSQSVAVAEPTFEQLFTRTAPGYYGVCSLSCAPCWSDADCAVPDESGLPQGRCVFACY